MFGMGKVEETAGHGAGEFRTKSDRAGKCLLSEMRKLLHDLADNLGVAGRIGRPLHGGKQLRLVLPVKAHNRALSVVQLAINLNIRSRWIRILGRIRNVFPPTRLSVSVVSLATSAFSHVTIDHTVGVFGAQVARVRLFHAGNAISNKSVIAFTFEAANRVRAGCMLVTVITVSIDALVHVVTCPVDICVAVILTDALAVFTVCAGRTLVARILFSTVPSIPVVSRFADAHFRGGISLVDAIGVDAALCAGIDFFVALVPVTLVPLRAYAHLAAVSDLTVSMTTTFETRIRLDAILSVSLVSLFAFARPAVAMSVLGTFRTWVFPAALPIADPARFAFALFHTVRIHFTHRMLVALVTRVGNALISVSCVPLFADALVCVTILDTFRIGSAFGTWILALLNSISAIARFAFAHLDPIRVNIAFGVFVAFVARIGDALVPVTLVA